MHEAIDPVSASWEFFIVYISNPYLLIERLDEEMC
jgi:hypothetical protein